MRQPPGTVGDVATSDAEVVARVRAGDTSVFAQLVVRHAPAAVRLAEQVSPAADPDVLVGEAFDRVLEVLQAGGGPDIAFRAYLLTVVRRPPATDRPAPAPFEPAAAFSGEPDGRAFASLPEGWQLVLWHLDAEGQDDSDVALLLGTPVESIPALAAQAREGLRQALLDVGQEPGAEIRSVLGRVVLGDAAAAYLGTRVDVASSGGLPAGSHVRDSPSRRGAGVLATAVGGCLAVATVIAVVVSGLGSGRPHAVGTPKSDGLRAGGTTRSSPRDIAVAPLASANGRPTTAPTAAATLAGRGTPAGAAAPKPDESSSIADHAEPRTATADVAVAARSTSTLPRSYVVQSTLRGVPAGRTTSLVVQGTRRMVLMPQDMSCTGGGTSRLHCTVGSGTSEGSFSVLDLGPGAAHVTLTVAPVKGFVDPARANNTTALTFG